MAKDLTKPTGGPLATVNAGQFGLTDDWEQADYITPRAVIVSNLGATDYPNCCPGEIANSLTLQRITSNLIFPLRCKRSWVEFDGDGNPVPGGRWDCKDDVPPDKLEWGEPGPDGRPVPPIATQVYEWLVLFQGDKNLYAMSFKKTIAHAGRLIGTIYRQLALTESKPVWLKLETIPKEKGKRKWFGVNVSTGEVVDDDTTALALKYMDMVKADRVKISEDTTVDDAPGEEAPF